MFGKLLRVLALVLLAMVLYPVGARFVGPGEEQAAALRLMRMPTPPVLGSDASDAAWLLDHDVPADRQAEVAAKVRRYQSALALSRPGAAPAGLRDPREAWPRYAAPPPEKHGTCALNETGCLQYVRENMADIAAALDENRHGLEAALAFAQHDGLRVGVPASIETELPNLGSQRRLVITGFAYRFASGERLSALEDLCRDVIGWRRIGGNADQLIPSMVGVAYVRQDLVLLSELVAELQRDDEVPDACMPALAEVADFELDLCPAMRYEFRMMESLVPMLDARRKHRWMLTTLFMDRDNFEAMAAEDKARFCAPKLLVAARADRSVVSQVAPEKQCPRWRALADPVGCTLAEAASNDHYARFLDRRTDQAAMLALMRTVLWLRTEASSGEEVGPALEHRPERLGLRRTPVFDSESSRVSIPLLDASREPEFSLSIGFGVRPSARQGFRRTRRALV